MSIETSLKQLPPSDRALIAVAVLLDGREAENYLQYDQSVGRVLQAGARELGRHAPDLRMPLAGTILREALEEMQG